MNGEELIAIINKLLEENPEATEEELYQKLIE